LPPTPFQHAMPQLTWNVPGARHEHGGRSSNVDIPPG
jgi:hypothetical protein